MAYDAHLADRIRELLEDGSVGSTVTERKMFGGLGFLVGGAMALAASSGGGIIVRAEPDEAERLIASEAAHPMQMRGRPMRGWVRVGPERLGDRDALATWVTRGVARARSEGSRRSDR